MKTTRFFRPPLKTTAALLAFIFSSTSFLPSGWALRNMQVDEQQAGLEEIKQSMLPAGTSSAIWPADLIEPAPAQDQAAAWAEKFLKLLQVQSLQSLKRRFPPAYGPRLEQLDQFRQELGVSRNKLRERGGSRLSAKERAALLTKIAELFTVPGESVPAITQSAEEVGEEQEKPAQIEPLPAPKSSRPGWLPSKKAGALATFIMALAGWIGYVGISTDGPPAPSALEPPAQVKVAEEVPPAPVIKEETPLAQTQAPARAPKAEAPAPAVEAAPPKAEVKTQAPDVPVSAKGMGPMPAAAFKLRADRPQAAWTAPQGFMEANNNASLNGWFADIFKGLDARNPLFKASGEGRFGVQGQYLNNGSARTSAQISLVPQNETVLQNGSSRWIVPAGQTAQIKLGRYGVSVSVSGEQVVQLQHQLEGVSGLEQFLKTRGDTDGRLDDGTQLSGGGKAFAGGWRLAERGNEGKLWVVFEQDLEVRKDGVAYTLRAGEALHITINEYVNGASTGKSKIDPDQLFDGAGPGPGGVRPSSGAGPGGMPKPPPVIADHPNLWAPRTADNQPVQWAPGVTAKQHAQSGLTVVGWQHSDGSWRRGVYVPGKEGLGYIAAPDRSGKGDHQLLGQIATDGRVSEVSAGGGKVDPAVLDKAAQVLPAARVHRTSIRAGGDYQTVFYYMDGTGTVLASQTLAGDVPEGRAPPFLGIYRAEGSLQPVRPSALNPREWSPRDDKGGKIAWAEGVRTEQEPATGVTKVSGKNTKGEPFAGYFVPNTFGAGSIVSPDPKSAVYTVVGEVNAKGQVAPPELGMDGVSVEALAKLPLSDRSFSFPKGFRQVSSASELNEAVRKQFSSDPALKQEAVPSFSFDGSAAFSSKPGGLQVVSPSRLVIRHGERVYAASAGATVLVGSKDGWLGIHGRPGEVVEMHATAEGVADPVFRGLFGTDLESGLMSASRLKISGATRIGLTKSVSSQPGAAVWVTLYPLDGPLTLTETPLWIHQLSFRAGSDKSLNELLKQEAEKLASSTRKVTVIEPGQPLPLIFYGRGVSLAEQNEPLRSAVLSLLGGPRPKLELPSFSFDGAGVVELFPEYWPGALDGTIQVRGRAYTSAPITAELGKTAWWTGGAAGIPFQLSISKDGMTARIVEGPDVFRLNERVDERSLGLALQKLGHPFDPKTGVVLEGARFRLDGPVAYGSKELPTGEQRLLLVPLGGGSILRTLEGKEHRFGPRQPLWLVAHQAGRKSYGVSWVYVDKPLPRAPAGFRAVDPQESVHPPFLRGTEISAAKLKLALPELSPAAISPLQFPEVLFEGNTSVEYWAYERSAARGRPVKAILGLDIPKGGMTVRFPGREEKLAPAPGKKAFIVLDERGPTLVHTGTFLRQITVINGADVKVYNSIADKDRNIPIETPQLSPVDSYAWVHEFLQEWASFNNQKVRSDNIVHRADWLRRELVRLRESASSPQGLYPDHLLEWLRREEQLLAWLAGEKSRVAEERANRLPAAPLDSNSDWKLFTYSLELQKLESMAYQLGAAGMNLPVDEKQVQAVLGKTTGDILAAHAERVQGAGKSVLLEPPRMRDDAVRKLLAEQRDRLKGQAPTPLAVAQLKLIAEYEERNRHLSALGLPLPLPELYGMNDLDPALELLPYHEPGVKAPLPKAEIASRLKAIAESDQKIKGLQAETRRVTSASEKWEVQKSIAKASAYATELAKPRKVDPRPKDLIDHSMRLRYILNNPYGQHHLYNSPWKREQEALNSAIGADPVSIGLSGRVMRFGGNLDAVDESIRGDLGRASTTSNWGANANEIRLLMEQLLTLRYLRWNRAQYEIEVRMGKLWDEEARLDAARGILALQARLARLQAVGRPSEYQKALLAELDAFENQVDRRLAFLSGWMDHPGHRNPFTEPVLRAIGVAESQYGMLSYDPNWKTTEGGPFISSRLGSLAETRRWVLQRRVEAPRQGEIIGLQKAQKLNGLTRAFYRQLRKDGLALEHPSEFSVAGLPHPQPWMAERSKLQLTPVWDSKGNVRPVLVGEGQRIWLSPRMKVEAHHPPDRFVWDPSAGVYRLASSMYRVNDEGRVYLVEGGLFPPVGGAEHYVIAVPGQPVSGARPVAMQPVAPLDKAGKAEQGRSGSTLVVFPLYEYNVAEGRLQRKVVGARLLTVPDSRMDEILDALAEGRAFPPVPHAADGKAGPVYGKEVYFPAGGDTVPLTFEHISNVKKGPLWFAVRGGRADPIRMQLRLGDPEKQPVILEKLPDPEEIMPGQEEASLRIKSFLRELRAAAPQPAPVVVSSGLQEQDRRLASLAGLEEHGLFLQAADEEPAAVVARLIAADARGIVLYGLQDEVPSFRVLSELAGIGFSAVTPRDGDFTRLILNILSRATGLEEAAVRSRAGFADFMEAVATVTTGA